MQFSDRKYETRLLNIKNLDSLRFFSLHFVIRGGFADLVSTRETCATLIA